MRAFVLSLLLAATAAPALAQELRPLTPLQQAALPGGVAPNWASRPRRTTAAPAPRCPTRGPSHWGWGMCSPRSPSPSLSPRRALPRPVAWAGRRRQRRSVTGTSGPG